MKSFARAPMFAAALALFALLPFSAPNVAIAQDLRLIGSGASFPFPIYSA